uniref:Uncharacterized protein n=1 Tax=Arundo donax TaxID=35708 RepID=A0A0A9CIY1_ARUDO
MRSLKKNFRAERHRKMTYSAPMANQELW